MTEARSLDVISGGRLIEVAGSSSDLTAPMDLRIERGHIVDMAPTAARPTGPSVLDASGLVVIPGLINGHTHSHEGFHRGRYPKLPLEVWMHYVRPPVHLRPTTEDVYLRTLLSGLDALRGGATTILDDVGLPEMADEQLDAVERAYTAVGIRALVAPTMFDRPLVASVPFAEEELDTEVLRALAAQPRAAPEEALSILTSRLLRAAPDERRVTYAVAASAPQRCTDDYLRALAAAARRGGAPLLTHVNETRLQAVTARLFYGRTMTAHLADLGLLDPRVSLVHGVWLTDADLDLLAATGVTLQHNPVSNLRLGSGLAPVARARDRGVRVTLGSDGVGSTVSNGMTTVVRAAALLGGLRDEGNGWPHAAEVLAMATSEAARALGIGHLVGRIAPGMRADVIGIRLDDPSFTPLNDPLRQVVYAAHVPVDTVVVDGDLVVESGRVRTVDEHAVRARIQAAHRRLGPAMAAADAYIDKHLAPTFRSIHRRLEGYPIPEDTLPARIGG